MAASRKIDNAHRVLNAFRNLVKMLRVTDRAGVKRYGLGSAQIFVLHELSCTSPLSVNELAERTVTDQSTVSVVVNKLVRKGYVESARSHTDGRRAALALTPKGRQIVRKLPPPIQQVLIDGVRALPPARARELAEALDQIVRSAGGGEEHPPMFFEDAARPQKRR